MSFPQALLAALFLSFGLTACTGGAPGPGGGDPAADSPPSEPDAAAIFRSFKRDPGFTKVNSAPIKSGPHMGDVDIYVDSAHASQFKTVGAQAPDGMTVVKVSLQEPERAYLMKKLKGYDSANSDWFYANTKADGEIEMKGQPQMCISCHAGFKNTDYLAAPSLVEARDKLL